MWRVGAGSDVPTYATAVAAISFSLNFCLYLAFLGFVLSL